ncbi:MAG: hypothetical protein NXI01_10165 [Gammaproteobacteria bacterium]|nr:hypothetical protein [Gammaproteobacteria bacterium]
MRVNFEINHNKIGGGSGDVVEGVFLHGTTYYVSLSTSREEFFKSTGLNFSVGSHFKKFILKTAVTPNWVPGLLVPPACPKRYMACTLMAKYDFTYIAWWLSIAGHGDDSHIGESDCFSLDIRSPIILSVSVDVNDLCEYSRYGKPMKFPWDGTLTRHSWPQSSKQSYTYEAGPKDIGYITNRNRIYMQDLAQKEAYGLQPKNTKLKIRTKIEEIIFNKHRDSYSDSIETGLEQYRLVRQQILSDKTPPKIDATTAKTSWREEEARKTAEKEAAIKKALSNPSNPKSQSGYGIWGKSPKVSSSDIVSIWVQETVDGKISWVQKSMTREEEAAIRAGWRQEKEEAARQANVIEKSKLLLEEVRKPTTTIRQIKHLLDDGANINYSAADDGYTALMIVVCSSTRNEDVLEYLLKHDANPLLMNRSDEMASDLVSRGSSIYQTLKGYELLFTTSNADVEAIDRTLRAGADVNFQNHLGYSALLTAVENSHLGIVIYLLSMGANMAATTDDGRGIFALVTDENIAGLLTEYSSTPSSSIPGKILQSEVESSIHWLLSGLNYKFSTERRASGLHVQPTAPLPETSDKHQVLKAVRVMLGASTAITLFPRACPEDMSAEIRGNRKSIDEVSKEIHEIAAEYPSGCTMM